MMMMITDDIDDHRWSNA